MSTQIVFQPFNLAGVQLKNRIAMAPMTRLRVANDGIPTEETQEYYSKRARGGTGLIITEGVFVDTVHADSYPNAPRIETPEQVAEWKNVVDAVHREGSAIAIQLWHTGRFGRDPIAPSESTLDGKKVSEMTEQDFIQVKNSFVKSAKNAVAAGFDFIEIHGAHGYLLDSYVSKIHNKREDKFGGASVSEKSTFIVSLIKEIRENIGNEFPLIYRFSQWAVGDYKEIKFANPDELKEFVVGLVRAGVSVLHPSTRNALAVAFPEHHPEKTLAEWTKEFAGLPVIAVGKTCLADRLNLGRNDTIAIADPTPHLELVNSGRVDILAIGRSLIANPDWVKIVRDEDWNQLKEWSSDMRGSS